MTHEWEREFKQSLREHVRLFRVAARCINEGCADNAIRILNIEIETHDISKLLSAELPGYARHFFGPDDDPDLWNAALMHHYQNNPHHWQYWLREFNRIGTESLCQPYVMTRGWCLTMIADWLAASRQYTGSWNMSKWLCDNLGGHEPKIVLHPKTRNIVDSILEAIGYWTNCDNAPLYCLIDGKFIKTLEAAASETDG